MANLGAAICGALVACSSPAPTPDASTSPWTELKTTPLPVKRLEPGVTALGQRLVVLGGFVTGLPTLDVTNQVDVFDVATSTWSQLPSALVLRHHVQLAAVGTTLYLLGGLDGVANASGDYPARGDSYALDTSSATPQWRAIASMPAGFERGSAAVVVAPPRIYLLGGAGTTVALATNIYYDLTADAWNTTDLPDLPMTRSHPAGMRRSDGALVVAGGLSGLTADTFANEVRSLTPGATSWQTMAPMPDMFARGGCAYGTLGGQLVCAGGEAGTSALSSVISYDPNNNTWETTPPSTCPNTMLASRAGTQGAVIGNRLFVPGGSNVLPPFQFEPTSTLYRYAPHDTAGCP